jgi:hypothetical protein
MLFHFIFSKPVRLTTSLQVGAKYLGYVVCRFHVAAGAGSAPYQKPVSNNLQKWFLSPTDRLNFGFITEGKLTAMLIKPSSWGSQLVCQTPHHQQVFWRHCQGERGFLQGESLTSNLFTLLLFCLVSLFYFICFLFIKIHKKIVTFIIVIIVFLTHKQWGRPPLCHFSFFIKKDICTKC